MLSVFSGAAEFFKVLFPEKTYRNFSFSDEFLSLDIVLIAFYIGIAIASFMNYYRRFHMGDVIRRMIKLEAFDEERAVSPAQLKVPKHYAKALAKGKFGSLVVKVDGAYKYYIPEKRRYEADTRYEVKGSGLATVIIMLIILIPVFFVFRLLIPELLQMLDNAIGMLK